jgi:hypothetical protein
MGKKNESSDRMSRVLAYVQSYYLQEYINNIIQILSVFGQ